MTRPYAVDTYNGTGDALGVPHTVEVPDRNAQLAHLDAFQAHHEAHGCTVEWHGPGWLIAWRHDETQHAAAIGRTIATQPTPHAANVAGGHLPERSTKQ